MFKGFNGSDDGQLLELFGDSGRRLRLMAPRLWRPRTLHLGTQNRRTTANTSPDNEQMCMIGDPAVTGMS